MSITSNKLAFNTLSSSHDASKARSTLSLTKRRKFIVTIFIDAKINDQGQYRYLRFVAGKIQ